MSAQILANQATGISYACSCKVFLNLKKKTECLVVDYHCRYSYFIFQIFYNFFTKYPNYRNDKDNQWKLNFV